MNEKSFHMDELVPLMKESLSMGKSVEFSPRGISMLPMIRQGRDCVTLSPVQGKLKKYDLPLYQRDNGAFVLHRIVKAEDTYTCIGDNQYVYEPGVRQDQIIAVVTGFRRDKRFISAQSVLYQLYCRFWHYTRGLRFFFLRVRRKLGAICRRLGLK